MVSVYILCYCNDVFEAGTLYKIEFLSYKVKDQRHNTLNILILLKEKYIVKLTSTKHL